MSHPDPGWELYRSFLAVFREKSLSGAARSLGLTQPTVGRHVDALEAALGVSLFTRSQSGLLATSRATELAPHAEAMASAASALVRVASGEAEDERGAVRVTASEMIGTEVLPAAFASFRAQHPHIDVELVLSNRSQDLLKREVDIAIRMVKPTQEALLAKKIGVLRVAFHAHPSYVKAHGAPRTLAELRTHPLIGFDSAPSVARAIATPLPITRDIFAFRCDSDLGQWAALRSGFGIGFCQVALGKREGLVAILPDALDFKLDVWVVMHRDLRSTKRVRLMFDHLARALERHCALEKT
jgi:DNA-binding transcriptional LysR family regulator